MTVDGVPRPRAAEQHGGEDSRPAVPLRPVGDPGAVATIAPPWLRVPAARPRGVVALVARDGREVDTRRPAPPRTAVHRPPVLRARPPVVEDPGILGLSRLTRGRVGSRVFTLFFVAVFALIAVQTLVELVHG